MTPEISGVIDAEAMDMATKKRVPVIRPKSGLPNPCTNGNIAPPRDPLGGASCSRLRVLINLVV